LYQIIFHVPLIENLLTTDICRFYDQRIETTG